MKTKDIDIRPRTAHLCKTPTVEKAISLYTHGFFTATLESFGFDHNYKYDLACLA